MKSLLTRIVATMFNGIVLSWFSVPAAAQSRQPGPVRGSAHTAFQNLITAGPAFGAIGGMPGASFSICYERFINKRGLLSVVIPLTTYTAGSVGTASMYDERVRYQGYHIGTGIAWHPAGNHGSVDFSLGILPTLGYGNARWRRITDFNGGSQGIYKKEVFAALSVQMAITLNTRGYRFRPTFFVQGGPVFSGLGDLPGGGLAGLVLASGLVRAFNGWLLAATASPQTINGQSMRKLITLIASVLMLTANIGVAQSARKMERIRAIQFVRWWLSTRDREGQKVFMSAACSPGLGASSYLKPPPLPSGYSAGYDSMMFEDWASRHPDRDHDTLFSVQDQRHLLAQYERYHAWTWQLGDFPKERFISRRQRRACFGKRSGYGYRKPAGCPDGCLILSWPLFSLNGKRVLFYSSYYCGGLCGGGGMDVFEWKQGRWQRIPVFLGMWIS